jgi:transposase
MDIRQQRGMELFQTRYIGKKKGLWVVPSAQGKRTYSVNLEIANPTCTCPDFEKHGNKCKHIYAAEYAAALKNHKNNVTTSKVLTVTQAKRKTYPQDWSAYNRAQTNEKEQFLNLLTELCRGINQPQTRKIGRPEFPLSDVIFCGTYKVYGTMSARRFDTDLRIAEDYGFIHKKPHHNSVLRYLANPALTPILKDLIVECSRPLVAIEEHFSADSTGFSAQQFDRWFSHKYGKEKQRQGWVKCHVVCGVKTNVITAVEISDQYAHDSRFLPGLLDTTAKNFRMEEISADKAYLSTDNLEVISRLGATPYIAFKSNSTGCKGGIFQTMYYRFKGDPSKYMDRYHQRSNVEATFSSIKRLFGSSLRSKTAAAMHNETLCKILSHNLVVLVHEMYKQDVAPDFWKEKHAA